MTVKHLSTKFRVFGACTLLLGLAAASTLPVWASNQVTTQSSQSTDAQSESKTVTETKTTIEVNGDIETKTITETKTVTSKAKPSAQASLAKDLIGTWVLEKAAVDSQPSGIGKRLKFFTGTHWLVTQADETGNTIFQHGGTYKIDGNTLIAVTNFAGESTASQIGVTGKATISVDGDTMNQVGLDNPYTETWTRSK